jgi:hypothetical protein
VHTQKRANTGDGVRRNSHGKAADKIPQLHSSTYIDNTSELIHKVSSAGVGALHYATRTQFRAVGSPVDRAHKLNVAIPARDSNGRSGAGTGRAGHWIKQETPCGLEPGRIYRR